MIGIQQAYPYAGHHHSDVMETRQQEGPDRRSIADMFNDGFNRFSPERFDEVSRRLVGWQCPFDIANMLLEDFRRSPLAFTAGFGAVLQSIQTLQVFTENTVRLAKAWPSGEKKRCLLLWPIRRYLAHLDQSFRYQTFRHVFAVRI